MIVTSTNDRFYRRSRWSAFSSDVCHGSRSFAPWIDRWNPPQAPVGLPEIVSDKFPIFYGRFPLGPL